MNGVSVLKAYLMVSPILTFFSAYGLKGQLAAEQSPIGLRSYYYLILFVVVSAMLLCWFAALKLGNTKTRKSVVFALWALWLYGPFLNLLLLVIMPALFFPPFDVRPVLPALLGQTARDTIIAGGFTIYLLRSAYVRDEYPAIFGSPSRAQ